MSRVNHYLNETGTCVIYTRRGMPRHDTCYYTDVTVIIYTRHDYCFYIHTYIDSWQKSTRISYWMYGHTGNCITRGMTILYFQFTLYIAGIVTGIARSQLLCTFSQSRFVNQVVVHCYNNTDNFFKKYILHII